MKYIKKFETYHVFDDYIGKLFIVFPSTTYFKSDTQFQIIFVDSINNIENVEVVEYHIKGRDVIKFTQYNGDEALTYDTVWDNYYSEDEFNKLKFMTVEEFYNTYESSYIRILEDILDVFDNKLIVKFLSIKKEDKLNRLLDRLTIPEVEHIINARKFNI